MITANALRSRLMLSTVDKSTPSLRLLVTSLSLSDAQGYERRRILSSEQAVQPPGRVPSLARLEYPGQVTKLAKGLYVSKLVPGKSVNYCRIIKTHFTHFMPKYAAAA